VLARKFAALKPGNECLDAWLETSRVSRGISLQKNWWQSLFLMRSLY